MSHRSTSPLKRSTVRRTLRRFWDVTRTQPLIVFLSVFSSAGYIFLLTFANTYVMALIVDRVQAGPVAGDQVFEVFGPYILALAPVLPTFTAILVGIMVVYITFVWLINSAVKPLSPDMGK